MEDHRTGLLKQVESLPDLPGCYLMKRWTSSAKEEDEIIYVGKAKQLRARVKSYFTGRSDSLKTSILVGHITHFDFIVVGSETEAFILENNLIKKHSPRYNIRLKDDKSYPLLVVNLNEQFPRIVYTRKVSRQRGRNQLVLGPFVEGGQLSVALQILAKFFGLRQCSLREMRSRKQGCLLHQMKQCQAPCMGMAKERDYQKRLELVISFFKSGNGGEQVIELFQEKMLVAAKQEEFERAALLRDQLDRLHRFWQQDRGGDSLQLDGVGDLDLVASHVGEQEIDLLIYLVRSGQLVDRRNFYFLLDDCHDGHDGQILNHLLQYYQQGFHTPPSTIVIPHSKGEQLQLSDALNGYFKSLGRVDTKITIRSYGRKFASLARMAADDVFQQQQVRLSSHQSRYQGLAKLQQLVSLEELPLRIECYDIAVWQGSSPTAAQVVFRDGLPSKDDYRHYHLEELPEGNNDFAMLGEVLRRRLAHGSYPDLFLVDGGKGQVTVFKRILSSVGVNIPVVGIAKSRQAGTCDRLILPSVANSYSLSQSPPLSQILVAMRDEAHRFSRRLHHQQEKKRVLHSWVEQLPGIGPHKQLHILNRLDLTAAQLARLGSTKISQRLQISLKDAEIIFDYLTKK
ncbi:MAG: excinuclease ABC subunit UvrC [Bdellovibrionales bacterium]|nr:excinuclease ABC subunit UvrC [Bdellovibrionales bacterium]MBT3527161.1 excinuclease ABC subunit UvrC [Bdellovibrionales bacterium]MBT7765531.1 excinuclease ABC subunit UvrC [Bdellovibrionales bacterium]